MRNESSDPAQTEERMRVGATGSSTDHGEDALSAEAQRRFWNEWNAQYRGEGTRLPPPNQHQAETVLAWLRETGTGNRDIVEVGCGSGWLCAQLTEFGSVRGIDISDVVLESSRTRFPDVTFIAGDFLAMELAPASADVVVSLEALSHVADQPAFVARAAWILRDSGLLMLATQNRYVLERTEGVAPPGPGQIRKWVDARQLRTLLESHFEILQLTSLHPMGHRGLLRLVNSAKLGSVLAMAGLHAAWNAAMERALLGHTLMALARKRRAA
jgi:2-polyprenyl-3-methyl-5-hydroxy-6-metoxy-1,4-benzoquinol methylase